MRVRCPHCGERDQGEFVWGGAADIRRSRDPSAETDAAWTDYLYFRSNRPVITERWFHVHGCRLWFERTRDTMKHRWIDD